MAKEENLYELYPTKPSKPSILEFLGKYSGQELFNLVTAPIAIVGATSIVIMSFVVLPWGVSLTITLLVLVAALIAIGVITNY